MRDFYATSEPLPLDQADGLRRLFAGTGARRYLPLAANPHSPFAGVVIERLSAALAAAGRHTLIVDAADSAPAPREMASLDLASAMEPLSPELTYFAARGLPLQHVDTRGSAAGWLEAVADAAPQADVVLVHANASDLARLFARQAVRPMVIGADDPESVKHAYASVKLLAQRCALMTFDLLLVAPPGSPRLPHIASSVAGCADGFLGCLMQHWTAIDPAAALDEAPSEAVQRLVDAQLALPAEGWPLAPSMHAASAARLF